jgi:hypothetical protein
VVALGTEGTRFDPSLGHCTILEVRLEKAKDRINRKIGSAKAKNSIARFFNGFYLPLKNIKNSFYR